MSYKQYRQVVANDNPDSTRSGMYITSLILIVNF